MLLLFMMTHRTNVLLDSQTKAILDFLVAKNKKTAGLIFREFLLKEGKKQKFESIKTKGEALDDIDKLIGFNRRSGVHQRDREGGAGGRNAERVGVVQV